MTQGTWKRCETKGCRKKAAFERGRFCMDCHERRLMVTVKQQPGLIELIDRIVTINLQQRGLL